ncbi:MAG: dienelactone hydrolase family protein [Myxococcales bacterium]
MQSIRDAQLVVRAREVEFMKTYEVLLPLSLVGLLAVGCDRQASLGEAGDPAEVGDGDREVDDGTGNGDGDARNEDDSDTREDGGTGGSVGGDRDGGSTVGAGGDGDAPTPGTCETLPPVNDYAAPGPFGDAKMFEGVGPSSNYTLFRPDASLGRDGFKHPIATWGNGIATQPYLYQETLKLIASHGFVIIACNDTMAERPCLSDGLDWLIMQNESGAMKGKLDTSREATIGYSWGGGAAIDTANRPNVKTTVSIHGMPPRGDTAFEDMHSPLILFTSTGDTFVTASGYVTPNYEKSTVQTFYATLQDANAGHLYPLDPNPTFCPIAGIAIPQAGGDMQCRGMEAERAPIIAWLRLWTCGDQAARKFFFGDDCALCSSPWSSQHKHWM